MRKHYLKLADLEEDEGKTLIECYDTDQGTIIDDFPSGHYRCFNCHEFYFDEGGFTIDGTFGDDYPVTITVLNRDDGICISVCKECFSPDMLTLRDSNLLEEEC